VAIPGLNSNSIFGTGYVNPFNNSLNSVPSIFSPDRVIHNTIGANAPGGTPVGVPFPTSPIHHFTVRQATEPSHMVGPGGSTAPAKKQPLSPLEKWLAGDTTYQQQLAEFNKSKADETTDYNRQVGITNRDYAQTQRELNVQAQRDRMDQQNDFAGRGILHSGVYAKALGDYNTDLNTKLHNLLTGKNDKLGDLASERNSFLQELQLQMNAAKQDAIRRRAQSLGI
jgi:hypothetical protein